MKVYSAASPAAKRSWKCLAAAVPALVFCSLLVPLGFLFGGFPSGVITGEQPPAEPSFGSFAGEITDRHLEEQLEEQIEGSQARKERFTSFFPPGLSEEEEEARIVELVRKFYPDTRKADTENNLGETDGSKKTDSEPIGDSTHNDPEPNVDTPHSKPKDIISHSQGPPVEQIDAPKAPSSLNTRDGDRVGQDANASTGDGSEKSCQIEFGSYCLWSIEHKEVLKDSMVKQLKDQLFVARAYYPSIAKLQGQDNLTRELKQHIQEHERMLSEAISDVDLPPLVGSKIHSMDEMIAVAKSFTVDCNNVEKKFRQLVDLTEDEAHFHMKQSAFLYHLGTQTMPKSLHCLSMRLTVEYFKSVHVGGKQQTHSPKLDSLDFRHYAIFSTNILAASVAINSTVMHSEDTRYMVFHILTDRQNYFAMKHWFARNSYMKAAIHVKNIEDLNLNPYDLGRAQLSPSEEFRISVRNSDHLSPMQMKTEYVSVFGHSHFLLPQIFKNLKKVVVLDDDVVVQRDLSFLWDLDLGGKVIGATEFCGVRLGQLKNYLGGSSHDENACSWISGLNIVDLEKWREHNVTATYRLLFRKFQDGSEAAWRASTLPISLLAFQDLIYPLDASWAVSGLGNHYGISADDVNKAAVLHYSGNMKPWLDLGIPRYKKLWKKFLTQEERFMGDCNVNP